VDQIGPNPQKTLGRVHTRDVACGNRLRQNVPPAKLPSDPRKFFRLPQISNHFPSTKPIHPPHLAQLPICIPYDLLRRRGAAVCYRYWRVCRDRCMIWDSFRPMRLAAVTIIITSFYHSIQKNSHGAAIVGSVAATFVSPYVDAWRMRYVDTGDSGDWIILPHCLLRKNSVALPELWLFFLDGRLGEEPAVLP
jgi:hypothetical protein